MALFHHFFCALNSGGQEQIYHHLKAAFSINFFICGVPPPPNLPCYMSLFSQLEKQLSRLVLCGLDYARQIVALHDKTRLPHLFERSRPVNTAGVSIQGALVKKV